MHEWTNEWFSERKNIEFFLYNPPETTGINLFSDKLLEYIDFLNLSYWRRKEGRKCFF